MLNLDDRSIPLFFLKKKNSYICKGLEALEIDYKKMKKNDMIRFGKQKKYYSGYKVSYILIVKSIIR